MDLNTLIADIAKQNNWKSKSRIIGEACEYYVKQNIRCIRCNTNNFEKCRNNEKSMDLICMDCAQKYQIKAKKSTEKEIENIKLKHIFKTIGGEYSTTLYNVSKNIDYIIILYENHSYAIKNILYIKNEHITTDCIIPRTPLSLTAKRAGWQGCTIVFNNIDFIL